MFSVMSYYGETSFSSQNYFPQSEIIYERNWVLFDQMKVSVRRTEPKKGNIVIPTIKMKPGQFHMIKSNKEVTLKTRETYFLYRKPPELKIAKKVLRKFSKNLLVSRYVESCRKKNEKLPAMAEIIN